MNLSKELSSLFSLLAEAEILKSTVEDFAEHDCTYGDTGCRARATLKKAKKYSEACLAKIENFLP